MSLPRFLAALTSLILASTSLLAADGKYWVYIGTNGKEIHKLEFDADTGSLTNKGIAAESARPSFLAIHPSKKFLYAVGEVAAIDGKKGGGVRAFSIDPASGNLTALNQQTSGGAGPCHLIVDSTGKSVLAANYGGGSVTAIAIKPDGSLGDPTAFVQHQGASVNPARQKEPHAHSVNVDPTNRFAMVADLGLDKVLVYKFDPASGKLEANSPVGYSTAPGAGPRHFAFHPDGKHAFVINELNSTLDSLTYDSSRGTLTKADSVSTLPPGFSGSNTCAEVQVHPSGRFVYGSNRGHNSIASFAFNPETGALKATGHATAGIKTPRNFTIDPTGKFALVASQDGDTIHVFRIDPANGTLSPTSQSVSVPKPVCVKFVPISGK